MLNPLSGRLRAPPILVYASYVRDYCNSYYFSPQVKNKPYQPLGTMCLLLRTVLLGTGIITVSQIFYPCQPSPKCCYNIYSIISNIGKFCSALCKQGKNMYITNFPNICTRRKYSLSQRYIYKHQRGELQIYPKVIKADG
jgi:hypothetical protein